MWGNEDFGGSSQGGRRGGGGFVPGDGKFGSPAAGERANNRVRRTQNIFAVTIKQLNDSPEETLRIQDTEVSVVSVLGLITQVETSSTKISYVIDDMTGVIEAHTYIGTDDNTMGPPLVLTENTYGRIIGSVRTTKGGSGSSKYIIIFKAVPVTDLNEITTHGLEVLHIPMKMRKLQESQSMRAGLGSVETSLSNSMMGVSFGETGGMNNSAMNNSVSGQNVSGLSSFQNMVFRCIQSVKGDEGVHVEQVVTNLKNKMTPKDVKAAIEFLSGEGHIYSTLDDEHYKCTDW